MRSLIVALVLMAAVPAFAYTDGDGRYLGENSGCDIFEDGCPGDEVYITAYGKRMKIEDYRGPTGGGGKGYCESIPGVAASNVLMETCMKMESAAGKRIGR